MSVAKDVLLYAIKKGYYVDSFGNVISPSGKKRAVDYDSWGYPRFTIEYVDKFRNIPVHRLVAYQKYGDKLFEKGMHTRHLNNNKLDYSFDNIAIGTCHENVMDNTKDERVKKARTAAKKLRKFTDSEVEEIRKLNKNGIGIRKLSKDYNVAKSTLSYIINRKTYNNGN